VSAFRAAQGVRDVNWRRQEDAVAFFHSMKALSIALRELGRVERVARATALGSDDGPLMDEGEAFIDFSFTYAHRVADRFARAVGPMLYEKYGTLHESFRPLQKALLDGTVSAGACLVDEKALRSIFDNNTGWYDVLRGPSGEGGIRRGIRDLFEHEPGRLMVSRQQANDDPPTLSARFYAAQYRIRGTQEMLSPELLPTLRRMVTGMATMATFFRQACHLLDPSGAYVRSDWFFISASGEDNDVSAFWPRIASN